MTSPKPFRGTRVKNCKITAVEKLLERDTPPLPPNSSFRWHCMQCTFSCKVTVKLGQQQTIKSTLRLQERNAVVQDFQQHDMTACQHCKHIPSHLTDKDCAITNTKTVSMGELFIIARKFEKCIKNIGHSHRSMFIFLLINVYVCFMQVFMPIIGLEHIK